MSSSTIVGRVGRDPELRFSPNGVAVCRFSVAVGRSKKVGGEWEETTVWHDVTCFNDVAEHAAESITKGDEIIAEGYLEEPRTYEKKDGTVGVSLPFVANALGVSLRWAVYAKEDAPRRSGATPKARASTSEEPF